MRKLLPFLLLAAGCTAIQPSPPGDPVTIARVGTGFPVGPGHLLTAAHVVAGCGALWAVGETGDPTPARVVLTEPELDMAVLQAGPLPPPYARLATTPPLPGTELVATGYPGAALHGPPVRTRFQAILLPLPRPDEQTTLRGTAVPGMSGSPVVDAKGEVVGMLLAKGDANAPDSPALAQRLGFSVDGIALMVPAPWLLAMANLAGVPELSAGQPAPQPAVARVVCGEGPVAAS